MSDDDATSWTVLRQAATGDRSARAEFVRRYLPAVRAYLATRWQGTVLTEQVEDTVQDVFLQFIAPGGLLDERLDRIKGDNFRGYLYGLVRNVARMTERGAHRRRDTQKPASVDLRSLEASEVKFSVAFDRAWAQVVMAETVAFLAERARTHGPEAERRLRVLRLRFGDGLAAEEIALAESVSRATIYREIDAACAEFRAAVKGVIERQAGATGVDVESQCRRILELLESPSSSE